MTQQKRMSLRLAVMVLTIISACALVAVPVPATRYRFSHLSLDAKKAMKNKKRGSSSGGGGGGFGSPDPSGGGGFSKMNDDESTSVKTATDEASTARTRTRAAASITAPTRPGKLIQISDAPLMFTMDHFMDPDACTALATKLASPKDDNDADIMDEPTQQFCLEFRNKVASTFFNGHMGRLDGMKFNHASSDDANNDALSPEPSFPDGVHMDTNNDCIFRHLTAILYLNNVEHGGATAFPLAAGGNNNDDDDDALLQASRRLLQERIGHTRSCGTVRKNGIHRQADATLIEGNNNNSADAAAAAVTAIRVQPRAGKLLLFFSRTDTGEEDARSWHGGERLLHQPTTSSSSSSTEIVPTEKHILTIFKQVDYQDYYHQSSTTAEPQLPFLTESTLEEYLSHQIRTQRQALQEMAASNSSSSLAS